MSSLLFILLNLVIDERVIVRVQWPEDCRILETKMIPHDLYGVCEPPPMPAIEDMPIYASWYNPELGGINCGGGCDNLAIVPMRDEYYGHAVACPVGMTTMGWTTVIRIPGMSPRACLDTGGAIVPTYRRVYSPQHGFIVLWVLVLDFLEREQPPFAAELFWNWSVGRGHVESWRR